MNALTPTGSLLTRILLSTALILSSAEGYGKNREGGQVDPGKKSKQQKAEDKKAAKLPPVDHAKVLEGRLVSLRNAQGSVKRMIEISKLVEERRKVDPELKQACDCRLNTDPKPGAGSDIAQGCVKRDFDVFGAQIPESFATANPETNFKHAKALCMIFRRSKGKKGISDSCREAAYWCDKFHNDGDLSDDIEERKTRVAELKAAAQESFDKANVERTKLGLTALPIPPELKETSSIVAQPTAPDPRIQIAPISSSAGKIQ